MGWSQIFLKIEFRDAGEIKGESEFKGFEDQIVLLDFDWSMSVSQDVTKANGPLVRKISVEPMKLAKRFDSASVKLLNCMRKRDPINKARITVAHRVNDNEDGLRQAFAVELSDARLESIDLDMSESGKSIILQEDIVVRYAKIKVQYYPVGEKGRYGGSSATTYTSSFTDAIGMNKT